MLFRWHSRFHFKNSSCITCVFPNSWKLSIILDTIIRKPLKECDDGWRQEEEGGGVKRDFTKREHFQFSSYFKAATYPDRTENRRFRNKEFDGTGKLFKGSAFRQTHLNSDWVFFGFFAYRPRQARSHFSSTLSHDQNASISLPFMFYSQFPSLSESHHGARIGITPALNQSYFTKQRMLSQHVQSLRIEILTERNSFSQWSLLSGW